MKTIYREKRYYCGEYLDVYIFSYISAIERTAQPEQADNRRAEEIKSAPQGRKTCQTASRELHAG